MFSYCSLVRNRKPHNPLPSHPHSDLEWFLFSLPGQDTVISFSVVALFLIIDWHEIIPNGSLSEGSFVMQGSFQITDTQSFAIQLFYHLLS